MAGDDSGETGPIAGHHRRGRRLRLVALASSVLLSVALGACSLSNLEFVQDKRLHFVEPKSRQLVGLPLRISWTMSDFALQPAGSGPPSRHAGYFAVFVDRSPVRPGQSLLALADRQCRSTSGCVSGSYLADRGVYTTSSTSITIPQIADVNSYQSTQLHEVTVVLMDTAGHRIGESAWYLDFRMKRQGE